MNTRERVRDKVGHLSRGHNLHEVTRRLLWLLGAERYVRLPMRKEAFALAWMLDIVLRHIEESGTADQIDPRYIAAARNALGLAAIAYADALGVVRAS